MEHSSCGRVYLCHALAFFENFSFQVQVGALQISSILK